MKPVNLQIKRLLQTSSFTLAVVLFPLAGLALDVQDVPNPRQINGTWVTDMAGILNAPTQAQINAEITQLEQQNGAEIAVVTVPETAPSVSPKAFTTALFKYWKIGKKGQNNGVLFLISKGDRRVEIETGYGVESILPDAKVGNIIDTQITPKFKQGDFNGGTLAGTKALVVALKNPTTSNQLTPIATAASTQTTDLAAQPAAVLQESTQDTNILWGLLGWGGLGAAIGTAIYVKRRRLRRRRMFIEPEGYTRREKYSSNSNHSYHCATCKQRLEKLDETKLQSYLSQPKQVAQKLGSVKFEGWRCRGCQQQLTGTGVHIFADVLDKEQFNECSTCQELTLTRTIDGVLKESTWNWEGRQLVSQKCHCCDYHEEVEETIPCLSPPPNTIFIKPTGRSRVTESHRYRPTHCIKCRYPMQALGTDSLLEYLNQPEQVAQSLGSVKFKGWQCPNCSQQASDQTFHILAYVTNSSRFRECPTCKEFTVTRTVKIVQDATEYSEGKSLIMHECHCCNYRQETEESIPRLPPPPPPPPPSSTWSRGSSWANSSWASSGGGGSSGGYSGGGGFGGGDSGGGGAGGGW